MEREISLECTANDIELVKKASFQAAEAFKTFTGIETKIVVVGSLSDDQYIFYQLNSYSFSVGGVVGTCKNGKIRCSNTLYDRLLDIKDKALPDIRNIFFGTSVNRKFSD